VLQQPKLLNFYVLCFFFQFPVTAPTLNHVPVHFTLKILLRVLD